MDDNELHEITMRLDREMDAGELARIGFALLAEVRRLRGELAAATRTVVPVYDQKMGWLCPDCPDLVVAYGCKRKCAYAYCPSCGARLDWSGVTP